MYVGDPITSGQVIIKVSCNQYIHKCLRSAKIEVIKEFVDIIFKYCTRDTRILRMDSTYLLEGE